MEKYKPYEHVEWTAVDGHRYANEADVDGRLWTWNARHQDDCRCSNPEEWY